MMEFKQYRFEQVTQNFDRMRVPLSGTERAKRKGLYPYFGAQGIIDYVNDFIFDGEYLLIAEDGENLKSKKQDIAQIATGQFWVNNHAHIIKGNELCITRYLCYLLNSMDLSGYITGSAQPKLSQANLNAIIIDLPDISTQQKIVSVISLIDDKIETNKRINDILSYQLQTIYNQMFSKSLKDSEKGGQLKDICLYSQRRVLVSSLTIDTYYSTENMLPGKNGAVAAMSLPTTTQTVGCMPGDVLVSNIRPYFKKIVYCQLESGCSADVLCFVPKEPELSLFLFCTLYDDHFFDYMVAGSKGTKMPRGDKQQIMAYPVVLPTPEQLERFNAFARPVLDKTEANVQENKRLSSLRDTLLPRLMSGEIDVSNIAV